MTRKETSMLDDIVKEGMCAFMNVFSECRDHETHIMLSDPSDFNPYEKGSEEYISFDYGYEAQRMMLTRRRD
jgi:hypothetical protein